MTRKVPGPPQGKERKFIPESFNNRTDDQPITVWIKTPTERQKREAMQEAAPTIEKNADGVAAVDSDGAPIVAFDLAASMKWQNAIVKNFCTKIENYNAADGSPIAASEDLIEHGETEIVAEVAAEILTGLSLGDEEKKPLGGSSNSTQKTTPPPVGTATTADRQGSQPSAGAA